MSFVVVMPFSYWAQRLGLFKNDVNLNATPLTKRRNHKKEINPAFANVYVMQLLVVIL